MYEKCKFITIIDTFKSTHTLKLLFGSNLTNARIEDWRYIYQKICAKLGMKPGKIPHTYVDTYDYSLKGKYVVIVRGMVSDVWREKKDPGDEIYKHMVVRLQSKGYKLVFIGTDADYSRNINRMERWVENKVVVLNDIKKSLGLLYNADFIISNDTGMYHAAGALNKRIFVMWKDTLFKKNKSPGKNCIYSMKGNWKKDFEQWIKDK
ncbi:MAG: glycosyltransferase family 9 protein [bacterium]